MNERRLSELQKEYRIFFLEKMRLYGVKSPTELTKEKKSEFFSEIKQDWTKYKSTRKQFKEIDIKEDEIFVKEPFEKYHPQEKEQPSVRNTQREYVGRQEQTHTKQIIKSEPNREQTDDLKIHFIPNHHFEQEGQYLYPVVKMPALNSSLKLPRKGRSNQKGYKENDFYAQLKAGITDIEIVNDVHLVIPNFNKPYEPDIVLYDKTLNLYIDIEIDEPYDGYYRYPTHFINPEDETKQDNIRDLFFTESGWVVIRFTERQVHCQSTNCVDYIKNVLNSIYNREFTKDILCNAEDQWDYNQCIQWQKLYYREKYLGIDRFNKQHSFKEIEIDIDESESIERIIQRTKKFSFDNWSSSIAFDEEAHKYLHPKDETGNAEYLSVTTLIERFFPFDLNRYIEKKAKDENRTEEEVLDEYQIMRDEAAEKGTFMHKQIENFLKGIDYDPDSKEFKFFLNFYQNEILLRKLIFFDAEKMIFSNKYNVAGTIDCLFKKSDKDEYVMLDWKRSKKLIIDGRPRMYGHGFALSELNSLDNSSYYRYCLQQNIYKYLIENEYSLKISSMKLVVLHENYSDYFVVNVPEMIRETKIILNSLKLKI
jgi:hypothetical protein